MHVTCMNHACYMNGIHAMNVPCMIHACMVQLLKKHSAVFKFLVQKPVCKEHKLKTILCSQQIHSTMRRQYQVAGKSTVLPQWLASQLANESTTLYMLHKHQLASKSIALHKSSQLAKSQCYVYTLYQLPCSLAKFDLELEKKLYCLQQSSLRLASSSVKVQH